MCVERASEDGEEVDVEGVGGGRERNDCSKEGREERENSEKWRKSGYNVAEYTLSFRQKSQFPRRKKALKETNSSDPSLIFVGG